MKLRDFILRRVLLAIPVIFGVLTITWFLSYVVGDPLAMFITERTNPAAIPGIIQDHGFNEPLVIQYFLYLRTLLAGDWGVSYSTGGDLPVLTVIARKFPATIELAIVAMVFAVILGVPLGILSATRKDKPIDHFTRVFSLAGVSMPIFWFALLLKYVLFYQFSVWGLPYLPSGDRVDNELWKTVLHNGVGYDFTSSITGFVLVDSLLYGQPILFGDAVLHLIMPGFCLGYLTLAIITRMMRSSMLEVMKEDYITLARSKGLTERIVIYRHALRNALIPTVTVIGLAFGGLMSGAVLTETIFNWPGLGRWATQAILVSDMAAINGFVLLVAFIFVSANLIVDLTYGALDPRIRYG
ncbi:MAG: peptide ABC transporter permease [Candidatus Thorarchaeota archaeon]|nr:MAG: peptide ABC transporter permease [Candidatus Thorarchaeota archaeon]